MISFPQFPTNSFNKKDYTIRQLDQVPSFLNNLNFVSTRKLDTNKTMNPVKKFDQPGVHFMEKRRNQSMQSQIRRVTMLWFDEFNKFLSSLKTIVYNLTLRRVWNSTELCTCVPLLLQQRDQDENNLLVF